MADNIEKLSSEDKKEWLEYLDWKIENEKSMQTWSGISIWILIGLLGLFGDRILKLISIYGLDDLLSLNSLYLVMCFLLVSFIIFDIAKITIYPKIRSLNEEGGILLVTSLEFLLYLLSGIYLINHFGINNLIIDFTLLSLLFTIRLVFSLDERYKRIKKIKRYKRLLKLRLISPSLSLIAGILLYILTIILVCKILEVVDIGNYTEFNNGADLIGLAVYLYFFFMSLVAIVALIWRKYIVLRLVTYRDKLFFGNVRVVKIREYIEDMFHGADFEEYTKENMKLNENKLNQINSKLSAIVMNENNLMGKLLEESQSPDYEIKKIKEIKKLRKKQLRIILKHIRLNDRKYVTPFAFKKIKN